MSARWVRPALIVAVALVAVAALVGVVLREGYARSHGTEIALSMRGADPRDLVRGHYVAVALADELPAGQDCPALRGDAKWVALKPNGPTYLPVGQYPSREEAQRHGDLAVRGTMTCFGDTVRLDIGIERYYINQADATAIDRALATGRHAEAIVSVGSDGRARLVGLVVDGKRYELNW